MLSARKCQGLLGTGGNQTLEFVWKKKKKNLQTNFLFQAGNFQTIDRLIFFFCCFSLEKRSA